MARNNIKIAAGAIVCEEARLRGDITIGANTIIHPCAVINADAGPIIIGENCLIEEQVNITHRLPIDKPAPAEEPVLKIGARNVFEVDATIEATSIGDSNVFEPKCYVGPSVTVPNGCIIGAGCKLTNVKLGNKTIIFGENCQQREGLDVPHSQMLQTDYLAKILPNYHRIRKPNMKVE